MATNHAGEPASYARRVKDDLKKYAQGLLEENARLRALSAAWQADEQRLRAELASADALCQDVQRLEQHLSVLDNERQRLSEQLAHTRATLAAYEQDRDRLARQLAEIHDDNCRYADQYVGLEQDNNNLANLYVITYQLHSTLDRAEVLSSLKEIVTNLVGSEEIALFELDAPRGVLTLIDSNGVQPEVYQQVSAQRGLLGRAIRSGKTLIVRTEDRADAEVGEEALTAAIPLQLGGRVTGLIAIFRLLPQKAGYDGLDGEIFDLLASQAAIALHCTTLQAAVPAAHGAGV